MLVSRTKQGNLICIAHFHNQKMKLKELRRRELFFCPACKEEVLLKIGNKKIPHFAHKKGAYCIGNNEQESEYHLQGKIHLYEWLKANGLNPELEPYYKTIAQRPDIGFAFKGVQYVIEFQCSNISEELYLKRTMNYQKENIIPLWLMAGKNIKRKGNNRISLSSFDYLFLKKNKNHQWMIPAYCPITNSLITMHNLQPISIRNAIVNFSMIKLSHATISDLLNPLSNMRWRLNEWKNEIRRMKNNHIPSYPSNPFLHELYAHSLIPSLLPPIIGLPVLHTPYIDSSVIQWQSYLYIDLFKEREFITMNQIYAVFDRRVCKDEIKLRKIPLNQKGNAFVALNEYMSLLVNLNIYKEIKPNIFQKTNPINIAENQTQQMEMEEEFYREYGNLIFNSLFNA